MDSSSQMFELPPDGQVQLVFDQNTRKPAAGCGPEENKLFISLDPRTDRPQTEPV